MEGTSTFPILITMDGSVSAQWVVGARVFLANGSNLDLIEVMQLHRRKPELPRLTEGWLVLSHAFTVLLALDIKFQHVL